MRKGRSGFFVLVQRLPPKLVDRALAEQMADPRIQAYLGKRYAAAKASGRMTQVMRPTARGTPSRQADGKAEAGAGRGGAVGVESGRLTTAIENGG